MRYKSTRLVLRDDGSHTQFELKDVQFFLHDPSSGEEMALKDLTAKNMKRIKIVAFADIDYCKTKRIYKD